MKKILILFSILMMLTLLVACSPAEKVIPNTGEESIPSETIENSVPTVEQPEVMEEPTFTEATIKITSSGFEPKTLTVKSGTTVTFTNEDSNKRWPASAMHPTHTVYPDSDIKKCGTESNIFDACKGLSQGESFSFTFNEKGSWGYHDHLRASSTGKIIVE